MIETQNIYIKSFKQYKQMGLDPVPIPYESGHPTKEPKIPEWPTKAANGEYTEADFAVPCNIGILLGDHENTTDLDLDSPESVTIGGEIMRSLLEQTGSTMIFGRESKPRSHYVFRCDQSLPTERIKDPVDHSCIIEYRCINQDGKRGQQTVFPPSRRYDSDTEEIEQVRFEDDSTEVPAFVEAKKLHERFRMIAAISLLAKHFPVANERHNTILALAGVLAHGGMPEKKASLIVTLAYRHCKGYNNDVHKAEDDVKSVYKSHDTELNAHLFGYPKLVEIVPKLVVDKVLELIGIEKPDSLRYNLTDTGNGLRLVDKHKDDIRYCVDDGGWYVWNGVRWQKDVVQQIRELAKEVADDVRLEANTMKPPASTGVNELDKESLSKHDSRKRELLKWANQTENADRVSKTIISAKSDPRIACYRCDFNLHGDLLNCPNGVVDLYTGQIMPHDRKSMMSNLCPVEFDPTATHPVWEESLAAFTRKHPDILPFLKRVAGYSIQGNKTEERILIVFGPGNSGKGTCMDWLTSALGPDYACAMDATSVLKQKRDSAAASGDIARLEGKRIVVVSEIEKGSRVQESFMKQASGNDALVARALYTSEREFRPTHQFWFQTNYRPGFDSTDSGNKRRYVEIPFDNDLTADPLVKFDNTLKLRMRQDTSFLKAVLAWCVQGCVEWRQHGLEIPDSVKSATADLFAHNDFLSDFLTEVCVKDPHERVSVKDLSDAYRRWCEDQGEEPAQGRTFNRMMEERGFERKQARIHGTSGKAWIGIRRKNHGELQGSLICKGLELEETPGEDEDAGNNIREFAPRKQANSVFSTVHGRMTAS